jgi:PKD repeat protein
MKILINKKSLMVGSLLVLFTCLVGNEASAISETKLTASDVMVDQQDCLSTSPIDPNQTINASLDGSECLVDDIVPGSEDYTYYDLYRLTLTSRATVGITMQSAIIDTYLVLATEAFLSNPNDFSNIIDYNDDADASTTNSEINVSIEPGSYIIMANSFWDYETGPYVLQTVSEFESPGADFTADLTSGPVSLTVNFTDQSTGDITSWSWDFGDEATSTEQNPSHTYTDPGTYTVSLTVTGPAGSDTNTKADYIKVRSIGKAMPWMLLLSD